MNPSNDGFLLLDGELNPIAWDDLARQAVCFPTEANRINQPKLSLADRVRIVLLDRGPQGKTAFVKEFKSGNRRYLCQSSEVACSENHSLQPAFILLVKRDTASSRSALAEISAQFGLTRREGETVEFLLQGLTSKEIGTRMQISSNTVKAFLRLVMVKMKVSTRSGIAGKFAGSWAGGSPLVVQPSKSQPSPRIFRGVIGSVA
jgi:DNA-binding CsgD family transcriptional regulator